MGSKLLRLCLMVLICAMTCKAKADEPPPLPPPPAALVAFSDRLEEHQAVFALMQNQWEAIFFHCIDNMSASKWTIVAYSGVKFDNLGVPIDGAWFDEAVVTGCGRSRKLSVLSAIIDGKLIHISSLPGTTYTDFVIQHDSVSAAFNVATQALPEDCGISNPKTAIVDTRFVKFTGKSYPGAEPGHGRPWLEEWAVRGSCGSRAVVTMSFLPDAHGTAYTAEKAEPLPPDTD